MDVASRRLAAGGRLAVGVAMLLAGGWVLFNTAAYRQAEAWSTSKLVGATVRGGAALESSSATLFVGRDDTHLVGLRIDQLCSTGAVAGLVLAVTGVLLLAAGLRVHRALMAVGAMVGLMALVNAVRLTALSWSVVQYGLVGWFEWFHLYGGSAVSLLAAASGCALYLRLLRPSLA